MAKRKTRKTRKVSATRAQAPGAIAGNRRTNTVTRRRRTPAVASPAASVQLVINTSRGKGGISESSITAII